MGDTHTHTHEPEPRAWGFPTPTTPPAVTRLPRLLPDALTPARRGLSPSLARATPPPPQPAIARPPAAASRRQRPPGQYPPRLVSGGDRPRGLTAGHRHRRAGGPPRPACTALFCSSSPLPDAPIMHHLCSRYDTNDPPSIDSLRQEIQG
jgi:hypothetical protein